MYIFILMSNAADSNNNSTATWTTWEELLLAFAVKRHGLKDWETVAMELQNRHRSSSVFTPEVCKDKYRNLRRRFRKEKSSYHRAAANGGGGSDSDGGENNDGVVGGGYVESFAWLEELRKLRVAELKQEVQRYDLSIETLQIKAKTLEEERENSLNENSGNGSVNIPDLEGAIKHDRSETDKKAGEIELPDGAAVKTASSSDENRSFNESNSTENRQTEPKPEAEPDEVKPDQEQIKPVKDEEDSCDDSSDRHEVVGKTRQEAENDGVDSAGELRDSVDESKEESQGAKESSDVQSSASLMMIKKCRSGEAEDVGGCGGGEAAAVVSPPAGGMKRERRDGVESEPLVGVLDNIWSNTHGSMFERRLESQKTERYKKMIKQHVDLETVQTRIQDGSYSASPSRFYVDLLLLVNNANVFFTKSSPESIAARELRSLVMKELKNNHPLPPRQPSSTRPQTKTEPEKSGSPLAKHKSTAPLIVCKKRSSISGKAAAAVNKVEKQEEDIPCPAPKPTVKSTPTTSNEDDTSMKFKVQEKPVTGVRSMRRGSSSKGRPSVSSSQSGPSGIQRPISTSQPVDSTDKAEASRGDKRKSEVTSTVKKKGAADFLKRMKKNEPAKVTPVESTKSAGDSGTKGKKDSKDHHPTRKPDERKDVRRSGGSGGGNKNVKEETSPSKRIGRPPKKGKETGKRGREGGEGEGSSKQPKKKSRR